MNISRGSKLACLLLAGALGLLVLCALNAAAQSPGVIYQEDINSDGRVNLLDGLALLLLGRDEPASPSADYNGDGSFSLADVLALLGNIVHGRLTPLEMVVHPVQSDEFLWNPGVGFFTMSAFYSWYKTYDTKAPPCANAYFRWYWSEIQPAEDQIDFAQIDADMEKAYNEGQTFSLRVMCQDGGVYVPQWLIDKGLKGQYYDDKDHSKGYQPDYSDPLFTEYHTRLIKALAERYDGHPNLAFVDIGSVGSWGEWNVAGAPEGFALPSTTVLNKIIDLYQQNFTKTKLIMLLGGPLKYAIDRGAGYRADCLGDWGMWGSSWSHMTTIYPPAIAEAHAENVWKTSPVVFEACGTMTTWYKDGMGTQFSKEVARDTTIAQSLAWHLSMMNPCYGPKFGELPDEWIQAYLDWGKKMGYRFVLRQLAHPSRVSAGGQLALKMDWENVGVAPCYYPHPLAVQLRSVTSGQSCLLRTDADITGWLPGEVSYNTVLTLPDSLPAGEYELGVALLDRGQDVPRIKLAVQGGAEDGWYRFSRVQVR